MAVSCFPESLRDNEHFVTSLGPQQPAQLLCELSSCKSARRYRWGEFGAECFDLQCFYLSPSVEIHTRSDGRLMAEGTHCRGPGRPVGCQLQAWALGLCSAAQGLCSAAQGLQPRFSRMSWHRTNRNVCAVHSCSGIQFLFVIYFLCPFWKWIKTKPT